MTTKEPLYVQVKRALLADCRNDLEIGDLLPSQADLAERFEVSLITIKRALSDLVDEGCVESIRGRGTVLRSYGQAVVEDNHSRISSWTDNLKSIGRVAGTIWTEISQIVPEEPQRRLLRIPARSKCMRVKRLRSVDGRPFCYMENIIPVQLVPNFPEDYLARESLYEFLRESYGLVPATADEGVEGRPSSTKEINWFGSETSTVLEISRISYLNDGTPLEIAKVVVPAHKYRYSVRLNDTTSKQQSQPEIEGLEEQQ